MKSILLIGLGRFGRHMARKLYEMNHQILAIDTDEERVQAALPYVTSAQIGDCTNEQFVKSLGVRNFDICVVAIGDNFQASLETTALLKDNGAPFVLARANRTIHAKFLLRNGADDIVYPEKQVANWAAVRYSSKNVYDYIELSHDYSIYEVSVPKDWIGKNLIQLQVRSKYHINVLAIKTNDHVNPLPKPDYIFEGHENILIMGCNKDLQKFFVKS